MAMSLKLLFLGMIAATVLFGFVIFDCLVCEFNPLAVLFFTGGLFYLWMSYSNYLKDIEYGETKK